MLTISRNRKTFWALSFTLLLAGCGATTPKIRALPDSVCETGDVRSGFLIPSNEGDACPTGTQVCVDAKWRGPKLYASCRQDEPQ